MPTAQGVLMTPFGEYLGTLRRSRRLMQKQVAGLLGVSPGYMSALEKGTKPLPSRDVLDKLVVAMELAEEEEQVFWRAVELSSPTIEIPPNLSLKEYEFLHRLKGHLGSLGEQQLVIMHAALGIADRNSGAMTGRRQAMT